MIRKHLLSTVVCPALLVCASSAMADDNDAFLTQTGDDNTSLILQSSGMGNTFGLAGLPGLQNGDHNELDVEQIGDNNEVGTQGAGFEQLNVNSSSRSNTADITQSTSDNVVGEVFQRTGGTVPFFGPQSGNTLTILQDGGDGNILNAVTQNRTFPLRRGNDADIQQSGNDNFFDTIDQIGGNNSLTMVVTGDENGRERDLPGVGAPALAMATFSDLSGATVNQIRQLGEGNSADIDIDGNWNLIGLNQDGAGNSADSIIIDGNTNKLGVVQTGIDNDLAVSEILGNFNDVGVLQLGNDNTASLTVDGGANEFGIGQIGVDNSQTINVIGRQNGEGRTFNDPTFADTQTALDATGGLLPRGLSIQLGNDNDIMHDVDGDRNVFAFAQVGNGNMIDGAQTGFTNMAAVVQFGPSNSTTFTQTGSFNALGVVQ
ncbi:hypothetical protein [Pseudoponticoccus marisrubri]|uniref:Curlin n=1 Tax=Pseudoponticoccus marisrubri TaxID=1685382 RepID=A0A0W7WLK4_9RHOB|nr:hypothetical protein [Pseudoponticoccus marisrubri]KUF11465.1 hypothetical protein AVJ23_06785 [Pseudoponticoccus marisrubri]